MRRIWLLLAHFPSRLVSRSFGMRWGFFSFLNGALIASSVILSSPSTLTGYALEGQSWPDGTVVLFQNQLGKPSKTLQDGSTTWNTATAPAFTLWNNVIGEIHLTSVVNGSAVVAPHDHLNSIIFASTVFGQSFGSGTLAVTYYTTQGTNMVETDILFNKAVTFDSYRGVLQFGPGGFAIPDIRRVLLHELGHAIGLDHPDSAGQHVDAVMNSVISNREVPSADDIAGAQSLYGPPTGPTPTPIPGPVRLANISTRMQVGVDSNVLIGGFIITGTQPKKVIMRAIGPSLAGYGIGGTLANPMLELRNSGGALVSSNDDWTQSAQAGEIIASGVAPSNSLESAIVTTLAPGSYTAIVRGVNNTTGVALVEGYDMDGGTTKFANISTRGRVGISDNVLIGGFIVSGTGSKNVIVRARGPSLGTGPNPVPGFLADPVLEVRDSGGHVLASNDNWASSPQAAQITATGIPPTDPRESAVIMTLGPGSYTAVVHGANNTSGVGLVEVFDLDH